MCAIALISLKAVCTHCKNQSLHFLLEKIIVGEKKKLSGSGGHADLLAIKPAGFLHSFQNKVSLGNSAWQIT